MTQKESKIYDFIFLLSLLEVAQLCIDNVQDSPLFRQNLKNAINNTQRQLDLLFESPMAMQFYVKEGGGAGTEQLTKIIHEVKKEFLKQATGDSE